MQKQFYFLSPVEVVKVSSSNLEEVAEWCGGKVAQTESRRKPGKLDSYIWVPTPKGSNISWAFPGMFITKRIVVSVKGELKTTWSVFRRDYFEKNYFDSPNGAVEATWDRDEAERIGAKAVALRKAQEKEARMGQRNVFDGDEYVIQPSIPDFEAREEYVRQAAAVQQHNHRIDERCDKNDCKADRYADGEHRFVGAIVFTEPADEPKEERDVDIVTFHRQQAEALRAKK